VTRKKVEKVNCAGGSVQYPADSCFLKESFKLALVKMLFIIKSAGIEKLVETDLSLRLEKIQDIVPAHLLRIGTDAGKEAGSTLVGLIIAFADDYHQDVFMFSEEYLYRRLAVIGRVLYLRFEGIVYMDAFELIAVSNAQEDSTSRRVCEGDHFSINVRERFIEFNLIALAFFEDDFELFFLHCSRTSRTGMHLYDRVMYLLHTVNFWMEPAVYRVNVGHYMSGKGERCVSACQDSSCADPNPFCTMCRTYVLTLSEHCRATNRTWARNAVVKAIEGEASPAGCPVT